jgi:hypothetical protein
MNATRIIAPRNAKEIDMPARKQTAEIAEIDEIAPTPNPARHAPAPEGTITPNELAAEMGISAKNLRRFMRSILDERAGSGNRWALTPEVIEYIKTRHAEGNRKHIAPKVPNS